MISISRPNKVPKIIKERGAKETKENNKAYKKDPVTFLKSFKPKKEIYGPKSVKKILKKAQHNKCCFCEKDQVDEYGAVEHYRPKKGFKINKNQKKDTVPGYYWLTYEWKNLLFVCGVCNTTFKKTYFGLSDETKRAKSNKDDIQNEDALLLNPCGQKDPRKHIYFAKQLVMHHDKYGQYTIEYCGLDRDDLNTARGLHISNIEARINILANPSGFSPAQIDKAKTYIRRCMSAQGEFSSMALDYLSQFNFV